MQPRIQIQAGIPSIVNQPQTWTSPVYFNAGATANWVDFTPYNNVAPLQSQFWFDSNQTTMAWGDGTVVTPITVWADGTIYVAGSNSPAIQTTCVTPGVYTYSWNFGSFSWGSTNVIPANWFKPGRQIRVKFSGWFITGATADTFLVYIRPIGSNLLSPALVPGHEYWFDLDAEVMCTKNGGVGTAAFTGKINCKFFDVTLSNGVVFESDAPVSGVMNSTLVPWTFVPNFGFAVNANTTVTMAGIFSISKVM